MWGRFGRRAIVGVLAAAGCAVPVGAADPDAAVPAVPFEPDAATTWDANGDAPDDPLGVEQDAGADAALPDEGNEPVDDPSQPGPWRVGVRTVEMRDPARNRTFAVDVWYPVAPETADGRDNEYEIELFSLTVASIDTSARRNATPAAGTFPLVLFSHGYGGIRFQSYFLTEHVASHGFVVASPDHPGNTLGDMLLAGDDAALQSAEDRPLDLLFVLDRMLDGTSGVAVTIDPERIGITGHSFGGWASLEVARRDDRIRVVFPMAPGFRNGVTADFVADLARPVCIFGGSEDGTTPFDTDQQLPYDLAQTPKHLLEVMGAGHLDFSNLCEVPIAAQLVDDGCDPAQIAPDEVHARVRAVATAFAGRYLLGREGYESYLDPAWVAALGQVVYSREP